MQHRLREFVPTDSWYHIARVEYPKGSRCERHGHDFDELFFIESGRGIHVINDRRLPLAAGDVVLIRSHDRHGFRTTASTGFALVNVAFETEVMQHVRERYFDGADDWPGAGDHLPATWRLDPIHLQRLSEMSQSLSMRAQRRIDLDGFLLEVLRMVTRESGGSDAAEPQPEWLRCAIASFAEADRLDGSASTFVELTGKSHEHVNRTIRRCMGQTTTELINTIRLDRAAHLLRMTDRPIVAVAMDSGFANLGYFYRRFGKRFGVTPRQYRRSAQAVAR